MCILISTVHRHWNNMSNEIQLVEVFKCKTFVWVFIKRYSFLQISNFRYGNAYVTLNVITSMFYFG